MTISTICPEKYIVCHDAMYHNTLNYCCHITHPYSEASHILGLTLKQFLCHPRVKPRDVDFKHPKDAISKIINCTQCTYFFLSIVCILLTLAAFLAWFLKHISWNPVVLCASELIRIVLALACLQLFLFVVVFLHCVQPYADQNGLKAAQKQVSVLKLLTAFL